MKSKALALSFAAIATMGMAGCNTVSQAAGMNRQVPDEFNVVTKAPLVVPPEFALRPPATGAELPRELDPGQRGQSILFGQDIGQEASSGERALILAAGASASDPIIRTQVDYEDAQIIRKPSSFVGQVLNFIPLSNTTTDAEGNPLNAEAEAARLRQVEIVNSATGGGAVVIERGDGGFKLPGT